MMNLPPIERLTKLLLLTLKEHGGSGFYPRELLDGLEDLDGDPWKEAEIAAAKQLGVPEIKTRFDCMASDYFDMWVWVPEEKP